jgi:hypothetical protein
MPLLAPVLWHAQQEYSRHLAGRRLAAQCRSKAYVATRAYDRILMRGLAGPSAEVSWACFDPHVLVCNFGLASRCIA